jgi:ABC-type phosphate/phosphonate transport system substrate-binding protein
MTAPVKEEKVSTYILKQFITICVLGGLMFWIQKCSSDTSAPKIASEILKQQNNVNGKKETFLSAIDISLRFISHSYLSQVNKDTMGAKPTAIEENSCLINLYIYSKNQQIPKQFKKILLPLKKNENIVSEFTEFLTMLSIELGNPDAIIDQKEFEFILPSDSNVVKSP